MGSADLSLRPDSGLPGTDLNHQPAFDIHDLLTPPGNSTLLTQPSYSDIGQNAPAAPPDQHLPQMLIGDFKARTDALLSRTGSAQGDQFSTADLATLMTDPKVKGDDAIALATLYELSLPNDVGAIQDPNRTPLSSRSEVANIAPTSDMAGNVATLETTLRARLALPANSALYADSQNPLHSINARDIHQGVSGDCYIEASLASIAAQSPEVIRDSIRTNPDGTFTVTFKGDKDHPVKVARPTEVELALYNGASPDGIWAPVMEKAIAQYERDVLKHPQKGLAPVDAAAGGDPFPVLQLVTGRDSEELATGPLASQPDIHGSAQTPPPESRIAEHLTSALNNGRAVAFNTFEDAQATAGLTNGHVYSVVGYTPGPDGGQVKLHNPDPVLENGQQDKTLSLDSIYHMNGLFALETDHALSTPAF
jgi:hypothetical protein